MLRCVNLLETYDAGSIEVDGVEVGYRGEGTDAAARRAGTRPHPRRHRHGVPALQPVPASDRAGERDAGAAQGAAPARRAEARDTADRWLARVGLGDKLDSLPYELSGGQQQRVGIARAVAMNPKVLLLDEITSALDPELVGEVLNVVRELARDGMTMILVTHEMSFARDVSARVVFMDAGRIAEQGLAKEVIGNPQSERLRSFLSRLRIAG